MLWIRNRHLTVGALLVVPVLTFGGAARTTAQTVTGIVRSAGHPVVGAVVRLIELDRVARTGAAGEFQFADVHRGTYRLFVSLLGYASATDTIQVTDSNTTATFDLLESAVPLREIVVSAAPTPRFADELVPATASKSRVEIDNSPGTSFAEKISDLPGVTVRGNGSAPSRPILRGLGDNEVLILENGLRTGDIATYDPAHATPIDALSIAQIDVIRGPASILYGPNTIGGLVNVITNLVPTVATRTWSGTAALEGNSVSDEYSGYLNNVVSFGRSALQVSAGGAHTADIRIPPGAYIDPGSGVEFVLNRIPQSFAHSAQGGLGYSYQSGIGTLGVGVNTYAMNYGIPGVPPNPNWLTAPPTTSRISQQRSTAEFRGLFELRSAWIRQVKVTAGYNDYTHSEFPTAQDSSGVSDPQANHFHKREFNAVVQLIQRPVGAWSGTVGLWTDVQDLAISGDQPLGPNSATTGLAAYAYEELLAAPATRLQAGLRYDYNKIQTHPYPQSTDSVFQTLNASRLSNALTASLGAVQQLAPRVTTSLSLARSFRAPTVQELFANGLDAASGTFSVGTATLGPETGFGVDASIRGTLGRVTFEVSPFVNYIDHYIFGFLRGDTIQGFPVRQFAATTARLTGFEASVSVQPAPALVLRAGSDYVNALDTRAGTPLPFIPPLRGLLRVSYEDGAHMGMVELRLAARQTRLGAGDTPTPGYAVVNAGVGLRLTHGDVVSEISLHCDNLLNRIYRDNLSVIKDFVPQPGRGIRLNYELLY